MERQELSYDMINAVENQINDNDPICARKTFVKLQELGCGHIDALELMGGVLKEQMNEVLMFGYKFNTADYELKLNKLVKQYEKEGVKHIEIDAILKEKYAGYDGMMQGNPEVLKEHFLNGWNKVKDLVAATFTEEKPELSDVEAQSGNKYGLAGWLRDIESELGNAGEQEARILFCKEVIETFAWEKESKDDFMVAVGEAYASMDNAADCTAWFEEWLQAEPTNPNGINGYIFCLTKLNQMDMAKEAVARFINDTLECDLENEAMFYRAQSLFEAAGDTAKADYYRKKISAYHKKCMGNSLDYERDVLNFNPNALKTGKVYPNDPCPCGSGKKYKKCCGRL